jgi:hypothetical protein
MGAMDVYVDYDEGTVEWMHQHALSARANSEDNPTWEQAMNGPEQAGYWKAMETVYTLLDTGRQWRRYTTLLDTGRQWRRYTTLLRTKRIHGRSSIENHG